MGTTSASSISDNWVTPLLTIFTPPAWCNERLFTLPPHPSSSVGGLVEAVKSFYRGGEAASECYPGQFWDIGYFAPGVCPSGWTAYTSWPYAASSHLFDCCPSGMITMAGRCAKLITTPTLVVVNSTTSKITNPFIAAEYMITVGWAPTDLDKFTPASAPLLKAVDRTTSRDSRNTSASTSIPSKLTAAAKGWVAVGIISGVLFFAVLGFLLARTRRHHIEKKESLLYAATVDREIVPGKAESDSSAIFEADEESKPAEADASNVLVELEANWYGDEVAALRGSSLRAR